MQSSPKWALHPDGDLVRPLEAGRDIIGKLLVSTLTSSRAGYFDAVDALGTHWSHQNIKSVVRGRLVAQMVTLVSRATLWIENVG